MRLERIVAVSVFVLAYSPFTECESDHGLVRERRTVGVFFQNFVNALQTHKQPAPNVVSFKPPRQAPQSFKASLLSSSQTLLQQKKSLLRPTKPPPVDTEVVTFKPLPPLPPMIQPPAASLPEEDSMKHEENLSPPQEDFSKPEEAFSKPEHIPSLAYESDLHNTVPHPDPHPSTPLKAQLFIFPFQGQPGWENIYTGLGLHPSPSVANLPFNYQAEIVLNPPQSSFFPGATSGRFSPDSGWHDVDEILTKDKKEKGDTQNPSGQKEEVDVNIMKYKYEDKNNESRTGSKTNSPSNPEETLAKNNAGQQTVVENKTPNDQLNLSNYMSPLFFPHIFIQPQFSSPFDNKNRGETLNSANSIKEDQNNPNFGNAPSKGTIHDRTYHPEQNSDYSQVQNHVQFLQSKPNSYQKLSDAHFPGYNSPFDSLDLEHHPFEEYHHPNPFQSGQNHATFKGAPGSNTQTRFSFSMPPNQPPTGYDSLIDDTEISDTHPNGYYHFKRSYLVKRHN